MVVRTQRFYSGDDAHDFDGAIVRCSLCGDLYGVDCNGTYTPAEFLRLPAAPKVEPRQADARPLQRQLRDARQGFRTPVPDGDE